jgi:two-component system NtrC family sensor kinase
MTSALPFEAPLAGVDGLEALVHLRAELSDVFELGDARAQMLQHLLARTEHAVSHARQLAASERREREVAATAAAIARIALSATSLRDAAAAVVAEIERIAPSAGLALAVQTPSAEVAPVFRYVAVRGAPQKLLGEAMTDALVQGDAGTVQAWRDTPGVLLPLASGGRHIGALGVAVRDGRLFDESDRAAITHLIPSVTLAMETLLMREDEQRQQERQRLLATALEALDQPVFICGADGTIRYANHAATAVYGRPFSDLVGQPIHSLRAPSPRSEPWRSGEQLHRRASGDEFPAAVTVTPIRDVRGRARGSVSVTRDLSDERKVAEQLRQSDKMSALGELVAGVAHEVNNPLTGISAFAQLLLDESMSADQLESVQYIKREADRAVAVVRDLLAFARKSGPRIGAIDINGIVEQTVRLRAYGLRTGNIDVQMELDPAVRRVHGDDRQLQQVLLNLIVNAEQAMAAESLRRLTIATTNVSDRVCIAVSDTGPGMTPEVRSRIFEPFFTTKPEGAGTGLGLSVSYGIIQSHGGSLAVESAPGAGATFRITLPAVTATVPVAVFNESRHE